MDQVFLQIFNTAITAGWLVLAVILARLLLKKAPAWIKCALWAIVALRLIWPFSIESVLSLLPSTQTIAPSQLYANAPQVNTGISSLNTAINPVFTEAFRAEPSYSVNPLQVALWVAGWVWVLGMAVMAGYAAISYLRIRRRVRFSLPEGEGVYLCERIPAPFILGIIRPKIYLPADLPLQSWDSILAHERAHLARRDHWWKPLGFLLLTVFWFHPLLWVAYILLCRDVELACDERVIKHLSAEQKQDYSNTLLECSIPGRWITACPLAFGETGVKQRIKAVLHYKKPTLWILIIALIACTVLAVSFLTDPANGLDANDVYRVSSMINNDSAIGYQPVLNWRFRITQQNILQYDDITAYGNLEDGWHDVGRLEKFTLTKVNFDDLFTVTQTDEDIKDVLKQIRKNNKRAWRVVNAEGDIDCVGYFLQQKNGEYYYLHGEEQLFQLAKTEEQLWNSIVGKTFVYTKEGFGGTFCIILSESGSFQYYEGNYSSHIGWGKWELKDRTLYLYDTGLDNVRTYVFTVQGDCLAFRAAESDRFTYVSVANRDIFCAAASVVPEQIPGPNLMWVQIEQFEKDHLYALDGDGNRWKILTEGKVSADDFILNHCWVTYYGEPTQIQEQLPDQRVVQYQVTAERCWEYCSQVPGVVESSVPFIYDYCQYDIDRDGVTEVCVLSAGRTSGFATLIFSVWENGVCAYEKWIYEGEPSYSAAFVYTESGLRAISSVGKCFDFICAEGKIIVLSKSWSDDADWFQ